MTTDDLIEYLPYSEPFRFVDQIRNVDSDGITGGYTFRSDLPFYQGHFKGYPVTPGAILTECCAQIGLVCLGIYLLEGKFDAKSKIAMTGTEMEFLKPVFPNERVTVTSEKIYFRFNKLKCRVKMYNKREEVVCRGTISGILTVKNGA